MKKLVKHYITGIDLINKISKGEILPNEIICKDAVYYLNPYYIDNTSYLYKTDINNLYKDIYGETLFLSEMSKIIKLYHYYEDILDDTEKRYLSKIIKPFKDKVKYIRKLKYDIVGYYIQIMFTEIDKSSNFIDLPAFKGNTMYKNMILNEKYTLDELGL